VLDHLLDQVIDVGLRPEDQIEEHFVETGASHGRCEVEHVLAVSDEEDIADSIIGNGVGDLFLFVALEVRVVLRKGQQVILDVAIDHASSGFLLGLDREIFDDLALFDEVCDSIFLELLEGTIEELLVPVLVSVLEIGNGGTGDRHDWIGGDFLFRFFLRQFLFSIFYFVIDDHDLLGNKEHLSVVFVVVWVLGEFNRRHLLERLEENGTILQPSFEL